MISLNLELAEYEEAREFTERDNTSLTLIDREAEVLIEVTVPGFMNNDTKLDRVVEAIRRALTDD